MNYLMVFALAAFGGVCGGTAVFALLMRIWPGDIRKEVAPRKVETHRRRQHYTDISNVRR